MVKYKQQSARSEKENIYIYIHYHTPVFSLLAQFVYHPTYIVSLSPSAFYHNTPVHFARQNLV